ncbi:MAG: hypothetical protein ACKOTH_11140, partial [Solirubrobacterales bacterium]
RAGPGVRAFGWGGYFAAPRVAGGLVGGLRAGGGRAAGSGPLLRTAPGRTAAGGLTALTALVGLSILWAPIAATAQADLQRLLLYLGALVAGIALLRGRMGLRTVEPALGAGVLLVIVYALADRLLPGLVSQEASRSAAGRLEQPLTYWNAMGALAAVGLVIALRVAGDGTRERWLALAGAAIGAQRIDRPTSAVRAARPPAAVRTGALRRSGPEPAASPIAASSHATTPAARRGSAK